MTSGTPSSSTYLSTRTRSASPLLRYRLTGEPRATRSGHRHCQSQCPHGHGQNLGRRSALSPCADHDMSCNIAEYTGLDRARTHTISGRRKLSALHVVGDSALIIRQQSTNTPPTALHLRPLHHYTARHQSNVQEVQSIIDSSFPVQKQDGRHYGKSGHGCGAV